jgi:signal transduction histidine kinase
MLAIMPRSPTTGLLVGLILTLAAVAAYSYYISGQMQGLRALQTNLVDRNRRASLQLIRIQNNLNQLGLGMRDMLDADQPYPLTAWSAQFQRLRTDLDDALSKEAEFFADDAPTGDRERLAASLREFWFAVDRIFTLAASGGERDARSEIRVSLQARQAALSTAVSRLLVENNEREEDAARQVQAIYDQVQRQVYWFLAGTLVVIAATGLSLIRLNRRLFADMASLSDRRRELAQQLIATRESTLRHLSRELHDELGQILTAMGAMLGRAEKRSTDATLSTELREVNEMTQTTLDKVRGLSQSLHPSILEELGLDSAVDWYVSTAERQLGLTVTCRRTGTPASVDPTVGIHVFRVLQEALTNVARHAETDRADISLRYRADALELVVEDHGRGIDARAPKRGLGVVAMRERAELVGGTIEFSRPPAGGTRVTLTVPLEETESNA